MGFVTIFLLLHLATTTFFSRITEYNIKNSLTIMPRSKHLSFWIIVELPNRIKFQLYGFNAFTVFYASVDRCRVVSSWNQKLVFSSLYLPTFCLKVIILNFWRLLVEKTQLIFLLYFSFNYHFSSSIQSFVYKKTLLS